MIKRTEPLEPFESPLIVARLTKLRDRLRPVYAHPADQYPRSGLLDFDIMLKILSLPEFAAWLRQHGDATQSAFGTEIIDALDERDAAVGELEDIDDALSAGTRQPDTVEAVRGVVDQFEGVRDVLVEAGALAEGDYDTPVAPLLQALLA